jgi:exopolysaccharide production protein ExoZ
MNKYRSIQGLRAIAALLVVMFHYAETFASLQKFGVAQIPNWNLMTFGGIGVPIFFVISGFVIGLQRTEPGAAGVYDFCARRVARIVPLYWTATLAICAYSVATTIWLDFDDAPFSLGQLALSLVFLAGSNGILTVIGPGWTLEYEMFFYLMFGGIVVSELAGSRLRSEIILGAFFVVLVFLNWILPGHSLLEFCGRPFIFEFCGGLVIARIYRAPAVARWSTVYLLTGVALAAVSVFPWQSWELVSLLWFGCGAFLVLGCVTSEIKGRCLMGGAIFQALGAASYAIYLLHMPLQAVLFRELLWNWRLQQFFDPHIALALLILMAAIVGLTVHFGVEKHLNRAVFRLLTSGRVFQRAPYFSLQPPHRQPAGTT